MFCTANPFPPVRVVLGLRQCPQDDSFFSFKPESGGLGFVFISLGSQFAGFAPELVELDLESDELGSMFDEREGKSVKLDLELDELDRELDELGLELDEFDREFVVRLEPLLRVVVGAKLASQRGKSPSESFRCRAARGRRAIHRESILLLDAEILSSLGPSVV